MKILGIDIGGTEIKCAFCDHGVFGKKFAVETHAREGVDAVKRSIAKVVTEALDSSESDGAVAAGISCAGNIDNKKGKVVGATGYIPGWAGFEVADFVKNVSGLSSFADNDAYCALYGELYYGAAKEYDDVCMLTLGTGVGGAVALDKKVLHGKDFTAGRLGHITLHPNGKKCDCGRLGCVEQYLSGRAFTEGAVKAGFDIKHGSEMFALAKSDDKADDYCRAFFGELKYVAQTLENAFDPEILLIGGGMANSYSDWKKYIDEFADDFSFKILPATLGNSAGIIGAAAYAENMLEYNVGAEKKR